ncbi:HK97 family phage prohead protease [Methylophaga sp. OBS4]|uniref:HK97 family phage prohead protease n=1 Tax=Methylophaga sp. OBS4 TaxID=2991935 RepID=UPI002256A61E|nr:HK97 family phage prohead protease [Methylophaga sp. OBS4]MCX4186762.1 HK97 family phage prohead protease [Methylophaga sp. OBS4]
MKHKSFPLEIKELDQQGEFSGYLSVFGNVDSYREVVMPGAFTESLGNWATKGRLPPILWQHRPDSPIGPFTEMKEDDTGLYVEGRLLIGTVQKAKEAYELLKEKVISGMSIGFETIGEEWDKDNRLRRLTKLNLWEGSIVTFPANEAAQVDAVKSILTQGELPTEREFEDFLREAGFSKTQAAAITNHGLGKLLRGEPASNEEAKSLLASLQQFNRGIH